MQSYQYFIIQPKNRIRKYIVNFLPNSFPFEKTSKLQLKMLHSFNKVHLKHYYIKTIC